MVEAYFISIRYIASSAYGSPGFQATGRRQDLAKWVCLVILESEPIVHTACYLYRQPQITSGRTRKRDSPAGIAWFVKPKLNINALLSNIYEYTTYSWGTPVTSISSTAGAATGWPLRAAWSRCNSCRVWKRPLSIWDSYR